MGDYLRVTRECTLDSLRPELVAAIQAHIERYELEDVIGPVAICCETISTKQKKRLFGSKTEIVIIGIILTPKWLIWAVGKENEHPGVLSARLSDIRVQDYEKSDMYKMVQDTGVNIVGVQTADGFGSAFIGLGEEQAAQKFRDVLKEAVAKA